MEDYIVREIDRIGELLMKIARKLGLFDGGAVDYSVSDIKKEFARESIPFDLHTVLRQENPILYLVEDVELSDQGLELFIDLLFNSDLEETLKVALLNDALSYLDAKGYYSFRLHSLVTPLSS